MGESAHDNFPLLSGWAIRPGVPEAFGGPRRIMALQTPTHRVLPILVTGGIRPERVSPYLESGTLVVAAGFDLILTERYRQIQENPDRVFIRKCLSADQRSDIRGRAWGWVAFYPDRIVVADFVLSFAPRSVGPDYDMAAWLLDGPYRYAYGPHGKFIERMPSSGRPDDPNYYLNLGDQPALPILVQVPLKLGATRCLWTALAFDVLNLSRPEDPTVAFGWITDDRLTLSIDLRKMPLTPGVLYGWGIVLWFDLPDPDGCPERALAHRKSWLQPMKLDFSSGTPVAYDRHDDHPAAALFLKEGFHQGYGAYFMKPDPQGCIEAHLDPGENLYEQPLFWIEGIDVPQVPEVIWNGRPPFFR